MHFVEGRTDRIYFLHPGPSQPGAHRSGMAAHGPGIRARQMERNGIHRDRVHPGKHRPKWNGLSPDRPAPMHRNDAIDDVERRPGQSCDIQQHAAELRRIPATQKMQKSLPATNHTAE